MFSNSGPPIAIAALEQTPPTSRIIPRSYSLNPVQYLDNAESFSFIGARSFTLKLVPIVLELSASCKGTVLYCTVRSHNEI